MTRKEQNDIIIQTLGERLQDIPNVQETLSRAFEEWFRSLAAAPAPQPPQPQQSPEPGNQGQQPAPPQEGGPPQ